MRTELYKEQKLLTALQKYSLSPLLSGIDFLNWYENIVRRQGTICTQHAYCAHREREREEEERERETLTLKFVSI